VAGFTTLFPFVLLATSDTPLLEIEPYLAAIETDIVKVKSKLPATQPASPSISLRASLPTFQPSNPSASLRTGLPTYPLAQLSADTGYDEATLTRWLRALERKKQIILYGPPGTGKTFMAEKLASHRVGGSDGFIEVVQFHPAYAYEDFVQGLRPMARAEGGLDYPLVPGRFLRFCEQAAQRDGPCVLIIDEINRANLAGVFGELMVLLEYRERAIPLAAGGPPFQIPAKVRLIGTMNTADRSIALVDYALRRRFAFIALKPNLELLRRYHERHATGFKVEGLIKVLLRLNRRIDDPHYELGITFFLQTDLADDIGDIWQMEIEPYLEEYFFDQPETVTEFRWPQVWPEILGEG
jgi:5-methylcytosine-specific restriction protein B